MYDPKDVVGGESYSDDEEDDEGDVVEGEGKGESGENGGEVRYFIA